MRNSIKSSKIILKIQSFYFFISMISAQTGYAFLRSKSHQSCPTLATVIPARLLCSRDSSGMDTRVSCHFLFQGIFSTPGIKPAALMSPELAVQFSSVTQSCPTLCDPMNHCTPGLPVHHQLPEFTQTHAHRISDAIQPSHPLLSPSPPAPSPSQHQSLFQ